MKKTNGLIASLARKMKRHENRLQAIENKISDSALSSSSSATPKRSSDKKDVPCEVRVSYTCFAFVWRLVVFSNYVSRISRAKTPFSAVVR